MNKTEKWIVALLALVLVGWFWNYSRRTAEYRKELEAYYRENPELMQGEADEAERTEAAALSPEAQVPAGFSAGTVGEGSVTDDEAGNAPAAPATPETTLEGGNADLQLVFTSKGGGVKSATLTERGPDGNLLYPRTRDEASEPVAFDFGACPALRLEDLPGFAPSCDFTLSALDATALADGEAGGIEAVAASEGGATLRRRFTWRERGYAIRVVDTLTAAPQEAASFSGALIALGPVSSVAPTDLDRDLGLDASITRPDGRRDTPQQSLSTAFFKGGPTFATMFGASGGGCQAPVVVPGAPLAASSRFDGQIDWVAARERFFVEVLTPTAPAVGVQTRLARERNAVGGPVSLESVGAALVLGPESASAAGGAATRAYSLYIGPKKMSELRREGADHLAIMRFGTWSWFCRQLLDLLNFLHRFVPNYGVAIILLTVLVRLILFPINRKSAKGMRKMSELQPQLKALQERYRDDPRKLQQEQMRLYSENHVNPLSSCLPMLIQLPIFIALFTVLRSAVELRYAPFLWIADLSEPENCFKEALGFGINFLPIAMAVTMTVQSRLTPSAGDAQQQKMMTIIMPIMMLVMCYNFASALGLYWSVSQALAIAGIAFAKRSGKGGKNEKGHLVKDGVEIIPPERETRQMRRERERREESNG